MTIIWKIEIVYIDTRPYQLEMEIIVIDVLFSCTYNFILQNYDTNFPILASQKMYLNAY
jgi:hypothetical protein